MTALHHMAHCGAASTTQTNPPLLRLASPRTPLSAMRATWMLGCLVCGCESRDAADRASPSPPPSPCTPRPQTGLESRDLPASASARVAAKPQVDARRCPSWNAAHMHTCAQKRSRSIGTILNEKIVSVVFLFTAVCSRSLLNPNQTWTLSCRWPYARVRRLPPHLQRLVMT